MEVKGKITKVTEFPGERYSYRIDEHYYSGFGKPEFKEHQTIVLEYKTNTGTDGKEYRNIVKGTLSAYDKTLVDITKIEPSKEEANKNLFELIIKTHKDAFESVKAIIGREPTGPEMTLVNSIVVNYLKIIL